MMIGPAMDGSGAAFDVLDIGDPVALPSCEAGLFPFALEAGRRTTKERLINTFERVHAYNRVKELSGSGTERVPG